MNKRRCSLGISYAKQVAANERSIKRYLKGNPMKPNPEQDADRAAFEQHIIDTRRPIVADIFPDENTLLARTRDGTYINHRVAEKYLVWQVAKADSRQLLAAFEQVCSVLSMLSKRPIATWYSNPDGQNSGYYAGWDDAEYAVKQALTAAAPYRKGGNHDAA